MKHIVNHALKIYLICLFTSGAIVAVFSQTVTPKSQSYIACPGATVLLGVTRQGTTSSCNWYDAQTSGNLLRSGSDTCSVLVTSARTVWVEPRVGSTPQARVAIPITISASCGGSPVACATNGTLLFKEDFGGNSTSDPSIKPTGIPQVSSVYTYVTTSAGIGGSPTYSINKYSIPHSGNAWYRMDDHTYPNDTNRGYMLQSNADAVKGQFYEVQINGLCAGTKLYFSAWLASLLNSTTYMDKTNQIFRLENPSTSTVIAEYFTGNIPDNDPVWKQYGFQFTVPSGLTSLILRIINNGSGTSGNDFVMDDIEIHFCAPSVTWVSPTTADTTIFRNSLMGLHNAYTDDGTFGNPLAYRWEYSPTGNINNPAEWTSSWTGSDPSPLNHVSYASNEGYYRFVVSNAALINQSSCRAVSTPVRVRLSGCVDLYSKGVSSDNCLQLEWRWGNFIHPTDKYSFTLYQWDAALNEWQTTSTNYGRIIKVLNVYPDIAGSNTLKTWMDDPAIGLGQIQVTPIDITSFNANPDSYLKNGSGQYVYDVIMFGTWDANNILDLTPSSALAVRNFLNSGRGGLFGHDTQGSYQGSPNRQANFVSLRDKTNLDIDPNDDRQSTWRGGTQVQVINDGFLLKYPHLIPYNSVLTIPLTHSLGQFAKGIVWMNYYGTISPSYSSPIVNMNGGTNDFYLTTWNNAAMIQTGHSNGASTLDERKIIANTLWYLAQFTTDTTAKVCSARDIAPPDTATAVRQSTDCRKINIRSKDNGTPYRFYVKATNIEYPSDTCISNILDAVAKSGLRGFFISEDNSPSGVPDTSVARINTIFMTAIDTQWVIYTVLDTTKYIHIQAIDSAGNLGAVVTLQPLAPIIISASANNICSEIPVTFTASPNSAPAYQWIKNGVDISSATAYTYAYAPANGDVITCRVTTSANCPLTSNSVTMNITPRVNPSITIRVKSH